MLLITASGNLILPSGMCTARVNIGRNIYHAEFLVLLVCSHRIILRWDFLADTDALIACGRVEQSFGDEYFGEKF